MVVALGLSGSVGHGEVEFEELWRKDFSKVLSNGIDSLYRCGSDGRVFNLEILRPPAPAGVPYAPQRLSAVAAWCKAGTRRVALVLNRSGEVLIFRDERLQFAKRRGAWQYYPHDSMLKRLGTSKKALRAAVYESCLDVSFSRSGGCVAILNKSGYEGLDRYLKKGERIGAKGDVRTRFLAAAIRGRFQKLDRRLRQELLATDGATILKHDGEVVTIVRVPSGSASGGSRAAAVQLSNLGVGIKISADGPITGFRSRKEVFAL